MALSRRHLMHGILALPGTALLGGRTLPGLTATVHNGPELHAALQAAGPGSAFTLAPGDYGDAGRRFVIPAGRGISVRAQAPLRTVLRAPLAVEGDEAELDGLAFADGIHLAGGGLLIQNSRMSGDGIKITGVEVEVRNCEIANYSGAGIDIRGTARDAHVHDNQIRNGSGAAAIRVGTAMNTSNIRLGARVVGNRIENISSPSNEVICVKSSGNTISGNTVVQPGTRGYISNRHGDGNLYEGNVVQGGLGFAIHDRGTRMLRNKGANIRVMGGNATVDASQQGTWPQSVDAYLEGNEGRLIVGYTYSGHSLPAVDTRVAGHVGRITYGRHVGTSVQGGSDG